MKIIKNKKLRLGAGYLKKEGKGKKPRPLTNKEKKAFKKAIKNKLRQKGDGGGAAAGALMLVALIINEYNGENDKVCQQLKDDMEEYEKFAADDNELRSRLAVSIGLAIGGLTGENRSVPL